MLARRAAQPNPKRGGGCERAPPCGGPRHPRPGDVRPGRRDGIEGQDPPTRGAWAAPPLAGLPTATIFLASPVANPQFQCGVARRPVSSRPRASPGFAQCPHAPRTRCRACTDEWREAPGRASDSPHGSPLAYPAHAIPERRQVHCPCAACRRAACLESPGPLLQARRPNSAAWPAASTRCSSCTRTTGGGTPTPGAEVHSSRSTLTRW